MHGDPRGYARVLSFLEWLRPEVVTVEISRFSLRYRQAWEGRWQRQLQEALAGLPPGAAGHPAIRRVAAQIALPFEYRAARDYSRKYGAQCLPLDLGGVSRRHLPRYGRELLSPANLRALAAEPQDSLEDCVAQEFRRARSGFSAFPLAAGHAQQRGDPAAGVFCEPAAAAPGNEGRQGRAPGWLGASGPLAAGLQFFVLAG